MNKVDAIDSCKWRKMIKDVRWSGWWVWVGECFFWYRPTRVVPDQRPLNGCVCVCVCLCMDPSYEQVTDDCVCAGLTITRKWTVYSWIVRPHWALSRWKLSLFFRAVLLLASSSLLPPATSLVISVLFSHFTLLLTHTYTLLAGWLLKSVEFDDDVALLLSVASLVVGRKWLRSPKSEAQTLLHWGHRGPVFGFVEAVWRAARRSSELVIQPFTKLLRPVSQTVLYISLSLARASMSLGLMLRTHTHACTHARTHTFNGPLSRTTYVSRCQKGKTDMGFTEARDSKCQWNQLG